MSDEKDPKKSVQFLTPPRGPRAVAAIHDEETGGTELTTLTLAEDGQPIPPGQTMLTMKREGRPGRYRVVSQYSHPGPSRAASPEYRTGWDTVFGKPKRERKVDPKDLN